MNPAEEQVAFYHQIGLAVTRWAFVEGALLTVAQFCVSHNEWETISAGYYSIENFRSKLAFVDSLVKHKHHIPKRIQRWDQLQKKINACAKSRNALAHRSVMQFPENLGQAGRRFALIDWPGYKKLARDQKIAGKPPSGALCIKDIAIISDEFHELVNGLTNFAISLGGLPEHFPTAPSQSSHPPSLRTIGNQIREAFGVQKKPSRS